MSPEVRWALAEHRSGERTLVEMRGECGTEGIHWSKNRTKSSHQICEFGASLERVRSGRDGDGLGG